jgi:hypothetical protein
MVEPFVIVGKVEAFNEVRNRSEAGVSIAAHPIVSRLDEEHVTKSATERKRKCCQIDNKNSGKEKPAENQRVSSISECRLRLGPATGHPFYDVEGHI